ncbi:MAG: hypothetical protein ACR2FN_07305 [Chitinophagaceae bacterium]
MRFILLFCFVGFILVSCKHDATKELTEELKQKALKQEQDLAFTNNSKLTIYYFDPIKVDTVMEGKIDTMKLLYLNRFEKIYTNIMNDFVSEIELNLSQAKLYDELGSETLLNSAKTKGKAIGARAALYNDTLNQYLMLDSSIRKRILSKKISDTFFRLKVYEKLTRFKNGDSVNTLDTAYYFFDKNKNYVDIFKEIQAIKQ